MNRGDSNGIKEPKVYLFFVAGAIIYLLQHKFFESNTINRPKYLYFLWGGLAFFYSILKRRNFGYNENHPSFVIKIITVLFNVFKHFIATFIIVAGVFMFLFGAINKFYSESNALEEYSIEITDVSHGTSVSMASIQFKFEGKLNVFSGATDIYKTLKDENSGIKHYFQFKCKRGLLGSCVLEEWQIF